MNPNEEFESRLNNSDWDALIANRVVQKVEIKQRQRRTILATISTTILITLAVLYSYSENSSLNQYEIVNQIYDMDFFYPEMDELASFLGEN